MTNTAFTLRDSLLSNLNHRLDVITIDDQTALQTLGEIKVGTFSIPAKTFCLLIKSTENLKKSNGVFRTAKIMLFKQSRSLDDTPLFCFYIEEKTLQTSQEFIFSLQLPKETGKGVGLQISNPFEATVLGIMLTTWAQTLKEAGIPDSSIRR